MKIEFEGNFWLVLAYTATGKARLQMKETKILNPKSNRSGNILLSGAFLRVMEMPDAN